VKKTFGWITLTLLGGLTLFEVLMLCLGQFGTSFTQTGPEPHGLQCGWFALVCKVGGLGISRKTGLLMLVGGLVDWTCALIVEMRSQHQTLGSALSSSQFYGIYVLLAVIYIIVSQNPASPLRAKAEIS
jgi:hypothetical protein